jgi:uncharacterized protein
VSEFVDANVFVRHLTGDDPDKARRSLELFQRARAGEISLVTSESVVAEVVFVLSRSTYRTPRADVAASFRPVLTNPGLRLDHKESIIAALDLWRGTSLDFEDCLSIEHVRRDALTGIYSYDRGFDRVPGIRRLEP